MKKKYSIQADKFIGFINDTEDVEFHIDKDDYFGTMATVLDLMKQEKKLEKDKKEIDERHIKIMEQLTKDLLFLQRDYRVVKK